MNRDSEISAIEAFVNTPKNKHYTICPPAYVATTVQGELPRKEERKRMKKFIVEEPRERWKPLHFNKS